MTITTYLLCFAAAFLGMVFHVTAVKIPGVKKSASVANMQFTYSGFFQDELAAILANVCVILIWVVILDELIKYKPDILPYIIGISVLIGFSGSSLLLAVLGKAQAKINSIVNVKTDISDQVEPPEPPLPKV